MVNLPSYTEIVDLVKKGATLEAQERIMELRERALELQEENLSLREQVRNVEQRLKLSAHMLFRKPFYFRPDDDTPFCPHCWESRSLCIHLAGPMTQANSQGDIYKCSHCDKMFINWPDGHSFVHEY